MTRGLLKSSKKKQRLYDKFLKRKTFENETRYKAYKNVFESTKKKSKINYYSQSLKKSLGNAKETWNIIKEVTGKAKLNTTTKLPQKIKVENDIEISEKSKIAEEFNNFFVNVGKNLGEKIEQSRVNFVSYITENCNVMPENELSHEELFKAFRSLKSNKAEGIDEISVNVVKLVFDLIEDPLHYIFNLCLKQGICPDSLKVAKVIPLYKSGDKSRVSNYRPISVLPCFSKILERIMYTRLYDHLLKHNILYNKQFGFQKGHSTEHAVINITNEILNEFDKNRFTIGIFIDLSKAFDTVNHEILLKKLDMHGIRNNNLLWFRNYLSRRQQAVSFSSINSSLKKIICGVPQGSILGPLLFLIYVNDLYVSSKILNFTLFADDTNIFFSGENLKSMFSSINEELIHVSNWFRANKLSLNVSKTQYILFMKPSQTENIPLKLPKLCINETDIKRVNSTTFLGVVIDEHLSWKKQINLISNKVSKNLGIMYKTKHLLNRNCLKNLYFAFIHSYLNYCNMAWASTYKSHLKRLLNVQKKAVRIIMNKDTYADTRPLMKDLNILNIYQMNLFQILLFMFKSKNETNPRVFKSKFAVINHRYPTRYSTNNLKIPTTRLRKTDFSITCRGPSLWNKIPTTEIKNITSMQTFQTKLKYLLLNIENETEFF